MNTRSEASVNHSAPRSGPLAGLKVLEFAGLGPAPFACMLLADMGADVVTVHRPNAKPADASQLVQRGRTHVVADLKDAASREQVMRLVDGADVLVEGFRPGVMERLGLGPEPLCARHPRLIYARMTGWGQSGPLAPTAGHDINFIALSGALHAMGSAGGPPVPPLNLVGDYGGGSMYLLSGILAALYERERSGLGQVVDAAISDGVVSLMTHFVASALRGQFVEERGRNRLDGGTPYYAVYETADRQHVAVGAMEPPFFQRLCERIGVRADLRDAQDDRARWPELRAEFARIFATRTRQDWQAVLENTDACCSPVLSISEAAQHPHHLARNSFVTLDGVRQPAPAPRFSRTVTQVPPSLPAHVSDMNAVCQRWTHASAASP
ncbi:MAG: hypothetical protein RL559_276 [Pseudomonadota bacterium]